MKKILFIFSILFTLSFNTLAGGLELDLTYSDVVTTPEETLGAESSQCLDQYRKYRNSAAIKSGLAPVVGLAGVVGSGMLALGWEYGGWFAFKEAIGPTLTAAAGTAINFVIPTALVGGYVVYETVMISRFVKASKSYRLVKGLYSDESNKMLEIVIEKVQKKRPDITAEEIKELLIVADQNGSLCNGQWVKRKFNLPNKYQKLATLKDIEKTILSLSFGESNLLD